MKVRFISVARYISVLTCILYICQAAPASITPAKLEVNLGPLPVDFYDGVTLNGSTFPQCSSVLTVRQCMVGFLQGYASQGVTGVRFQLGLAGGGNSTAFDGQGNVRPTWANNLALFFSDVHSAGIQRVTPTSVTADSWSGPLQAINAAYNAAPGCPSGSKLLNFFPWLPFGLDPNNHNWPDGQGNNQSYFCSPANPIFWGWSKFFLLEDTVMGKAQSAGLIVNEFDIQNEVDLLNFTVMARLIYDNITSTPVFSNAGQVMANHGFSSTRATVSVSTARPNTPAGDCGSVYGDSAHLLLSSELLAATGGAKIGFPPYISVQGDMACDNSTPACGSPGSNPNWAACATAGMITLPVTQPTPTIVDIHNSPCVVPNGTCDTSIDATSTAQNMYNDLWSFLQSRGLTRSTAMIGETWSSTPNSTNCDGGEIQATAFQNVNGFLSSNLFSADAGNVIFRPWENAVSNQCQTPAAIGAPSGPYTP